MVGQKDYLWQKSLEPCFPLPKVPSDRTCSGEVLTSPGLQNVFRVFLSSASDPSPDCKSLLSASSGLAWKRGGANSLKGSPQLMGARRLWKNVSATYLSDGQF